MTDTIRFTRRIQIRSFRYLLLFHLLTGLFVVATTAQTSTRPTDGTTPLGITPGAPAGSYALSGFDNVNLFNGSLNFRLPLRSVGGRGSAGYTMMLAMEKHWTVTHQSQIAGCFPSGQCTYNHTFYPSSAWWGGISVGYGPGTMKGRKASDTKCSPGTPNSDGLYRKLTRITFTAPDGTEYEMIDKLTGGKVIDNSLNTCYWYTQAPSRGKVFITADGSAATFISDTTIFDGSLSTYEEFYPSGYLMLRDGTRYRIVNGLVDWLRDRNGNKLTFTYDANKRVTSITDSLNRQVTVSYANLTSTFCDQISFNGSGGAQRTIRIWWSLLGAILKPQNPNVTAPQTYYQLFPELNGSSNSTTYNHHMVSSVELPDGRSYQFKYNEYGELARVILPTGGAYEYDYGPGRYETAPSGVVDASQTHKFIYRRIVQRRVYKDGGSTPESRTTYGRPELYPNSSGPVQVDHLDSSGTTLLAREKHYFYNTPLISLQTYQPVGYPAWTDGKEYKTETFDAAGTTLLRRVEHTWQQRAPVSWWTQGASSAPPNDPRITQTLLTVEPASANQVTKQTFTYDQYNNKTDSYEYDFGPGAPAANYTRRTHTDYLMTNPVNGAAYDTVNPDTTNPDVSATIHLRSLPTRNQVFDASGVERARTTYEYDNYVPDPPNNAHAALIARSGITGLCDGSPQTCPNQPNFTDPNYQRRGNVTGKTSFANAASQSGPVTSFTQYDVAGNPVASIDGLLRKTSFSYADAFCNGSTCGGTFIPNTYALVTGTTSPVPDPTGQYGATTSFITSSVYDFWTGQVTSTTDANNQTSNISYNDLLERPTQVIRAVGTAIANQTTFNYDDVSRIITTTSDLNAYNDNLLKSQRVYDGLGRTTEARQYEGGTNFIAVKSIPFVMQQDPDTAAWVGASQTSNPYRPYLGEQPVWTTTFFDTSDRIVKVRTPDNSIVRTSYSGNTVTVTDQITRKRKSVTDALGRLKEVYEDPLGVNYQTSYNYDVLDNLTTVTQGTQTRTFVYDSLRRLTSATNPESGMVTYQYDNNGNLTQKTDARGVISTYAYDALNRNTTIDYSDTTPDSFRQYDQAIKGKGRLNQVWQAGTTTSATYIDSYDELGRPLIQRQRYETGGVWSSSYQIQRAYNRAGAVTSQTYPSGRTVTYEYDSAGRLFNFTGTLGDGVNRNYSTEIIYSSLGGMAKEKFGTDTPLYNKTFYNSRGQMSEIRVGTTFNSLTDGGWERGAIINHYSAQCWGACNGTDNNGNVKQQDHWIPDSNGGLQAVIVQGYAYDSLNRLQRVQEGSWQQEYVYDRWGNRTIHQTNTWGTGINKKDFTVNTANNRLGVPAGQSGVMTYDNAGNLTNDTYTGAGSRVYDGENRMTKAWGGNNQWQEYAYNADGQRTRRKINGIETWQIYGMAGELLAEYAAGAAPTSPQKEYGYRNGQLLVTATAPPTAGTGLQGQYFDNMNFTDLKVTRTDATVDFDWGLGSPSPAIGVDTFTVRWQGKVEPQFSQTYTFYTHSDDGVRLWVNGQLLIDKWIDQGLTEWSGQIALTAGQRYDIVLEYYENGGGALAKLWWSSASQPKQIIPQSRLYPPATFTWLVADHLGTPRIILDKTGSLANTKRHDYLPFGEELYAGVGSRTTALGYTGGDGVRQQFTQKERDVETGLDYFGARYYASIQGRFTSPDPLHSSGRPIYPQSWNRYSYVMNHPLSLVDPNGLDWGVAKWWDQEKKEWHIDYHYFPGDVGDWNGHTYTPVDFGGDATRTLNLSDGRTVAISNNPDALGGAYMRDVTSHPQAEQEPVLPPSWVDYVPVARNARQFLFHFTTHNFEAALLDFSVLSVELGTANLAASAGAARSFATGPGEAIFFSGRGTFQLATQAAKSEGGKLITDTIGGQALNVLTKPLPARVANPFWNWGSKHFAEGASGNVRVFLREPLRTNSTWAQVEYPILRVNPFVRIIQR